MKKVFEGTLTALVTPFKSGAIDEAALRGLVNWQIEAGIDGLVAVGTTGESPTLSASEAARVVEIVVAETGGRVPVVAGTGGNNTAEAIERTKRAKAAGADAALLVVPYYNKPTQEGLYQHFTRIVNDAVFPAILYNVPGRTVADLLPETVARLAENPNVIAIKEATGDMRRASEIRALVGDRLTLLSGDDFTYLPFCSVGGRGAISVTSNVAPREMASLWDHIARGEWTEARRLHDRLLPLHRALFLEANPIPVKAAVAALGRAGDEIRLPLTPVSASVREKVVGAMRGLGLLS
ncbi:MAG: 4-hydroxy-tetrahydrodipicolinate synthase [Deltaproteobacteria bacterium]|nr:4-hydroxy-tetrahydrodipicolinate synthase [Deltaproteobacteria bacterium]